MTPLRKINALNAKKKRALMLGAGAAVIAVLFAARTAARPGQLLLFLYNLGFSQEVSGPLYDYETGIVLSLSAVVFGTFALLIGRELRRSGFSPHSPECSGCSFFSRSRPSPSLMRSRILKLPSS